MATPRGDEAQRLVIDMAVLGPITPKQLSNWFDNKRARLGLGAVGTGSGGGRGPVNMAGRGEPQGGTEEREGHTLLSRLTELFDTGMATPRGDEVGRCKLTGWNPH